MKLLSTLLLFTLFLFSGSLSGQNSALDLIRVIPPSPTASAMAKFEEIPVSPYTGLTNINIPIYQITNRELNVPISLNYHSGGIKVAEEASWVGLGWNLNSGGSITRIVKGLDDIPTKGLTRGYPDSYLPESIDPSSNKYIEPSDEDQRHYDEQFLMDVVDGKVDPEPDVFVFSFNGRNGKFILDKRATPSAPLVPMLISQEDLSIEVSYISENANYRWIITDEKGIKYFFGTAETTISRTGSGEDEFTADNNAPEGLPSEVVSTWYLDRILSPAGAEIKYNYFSIYPEGGGTKRVLSRSQMKKHVTFLHAYEGCTVPMNEFTCFSNYIEVRDVYLKEIIFPNGKIEFKVSDRNDIEPVSLSSPSYSKKVDEINIFELSGNTYSLLKKYIFNYSYFGENKGYNGKRLKLDSVSESSGNMLLPPYKFTYNQIELPNKDSKSIDHWGFYNGADNESINDPVFGPLPGGTLIPPASIFSLQADEYKEFVGADRNPNPDYVQAGILTSITYPTGGSRHFQYEINDYYHPTTKVLEDVNEEFITNFGSDTGIDNVRPSTYTLNLFEPTEVKVYSSILCHGGKTCLGQSDEYEYDVAKIISLNNTPSFDEGIGFLLTYENQDEDVEQEMLLDLQPGSYKFSVFADENYFSRLRIVWSEKDIIEVNNHNGAGLRIKEIETKDPMNSSKNQSINYSYTKLVGSKTVSSGKLMVIPKYTYENRMRKRCETNYLSINATSIVRTSSTVIPFSNSAMGNSIGYEKVTEWRQNLGKTAYIYSNVEDVIPVPFYPNVPTQGYIGNGLLKHKTIYSSNPDGSFNKLTESINVYHEELGRTKKIKAMKINGADAYEYFQMAADNSGRRAHYDNVKFYDIASEWIHPQESRVITSSDDNSIQESTIYKYSNSDQVQLTEKIMTDSKGSQLNTVYKYPFDYLNNPLYEQMTQNNQLNVIEQIETLNTVHNQSIRTNYEIWPDNLILPVSVDMKIGEGQYQPRIRYHSYSLDGLLLSQSYENNVRQSFIWGYDQIPIVEVKNAVPSEIAYTSFECNERGGLIYNGTAITDKEDAFTGKCYYSVSDEIIKEGLNSDKKYILSYWKKNGTPVLTGGIISAAKIGSTHNGWTYIEHEIIGTTNITISGTGYIDELRLFPKDAEMTSYTYRPLLGMTSKSDANGRTTFYEYDDLGRLKLMKDHEGNIVMSNKYHYKFE